MGMLRGGPAEGTGASGRIPIFSPQLVLLRSLVVYFSILSLAGCSGETETSRSSGPWDHLMSPGSGQFLHVSSFDTTGGNRDRHEIAPGDSAVLLDVEGPGVIRQLWITVASSDPDYLRRIALKMYWDGETDPSVAVPLGDFFGNGFEKTHYTALPMGVSSGGFYAYLPMPFRRRARIVAENGTGEVVDALYFNANVELDTPLPRPLATFHALWNRDPRTQGPESHLILQARGEGQLVGVNLNAEAYDGSYWFLEGDEIYTVDGEFRGQGTGTEDYFNGGWYFQDGPFSAPYHGVILMDPDRGRVAAYRWHLPDPIGFRDSIRMEIEHGHGNEVVADYATTAYWYQTEPHQPLPPLPRPNDRRVLDVKIPPGAFFRDSMEVTQGTRGERIGWVRPPMEDRYEVWSYPEGPGGRPLEPVSLGQRTALAEGRRGLALSVVAPPGEDLPLAVVLKPVPRWATEWMAVGPFPNPQRLGTEYSPALDSVYGPELDPGLDRSYATANGSVLRWEPVDGDETGYVRLNPHFDPNDHVAAYVQSFLYSAQERTVNFLLGADDGHQLWINGEEVSRRQGRNITVPDDLRVRARLREGWNRVLLKVADLDGGWAFQIRVADPIGRLRWSRKPPA